MYSEATINQASIIKEVIDAVLQGKEIQLYKESMLVGAGEDPDLILVLQYPCRVKPTPEFIPFDFTDAEFLIGKVVKCKSEIQVITQLNKDYVFAGVGQMHYSWLLEKYTFLDGSPCGKLK